MGITALKCPGCGANVEFDSNRDYGFCEYCGTKVMQEKIVVEHKIDESQKYLNFLRLANQAYSAGNYSEAYDYYTRSLEVRQDDYLVIFRKALCAGYLSVSGERNAEVVSGVRSAYALAGKAKEKELATEITMLLGSKPLKAPAEFVGQGSCAGYVEMVRGHITLADSLYSFVDNENPDMVERFCKNIVTACDLIKETYTYTKVSDGRKSNINVNLSLSGLSLRSNFEPDAPQIYKTPQVILNEIAAIRRKYIEESNKFVASKLTRQENLITQAKKEVADLPAQFRILHYVFCFPAVIAVLIISLFVPVLGLILLVAQTVCYIIYLKTDENKEAQNAYSNLRELNEEYRKTKNTLNK